MKNIKDTLSKPFSSISAWCKSHESFIAVTVTRLVAVVFIIIAFVFLLKSLGLL